MMTPEELQRTLRPILSSIDEPEDGDEDDHPSNAVIGLREWGSAKVFPLHALSIHQPGHQPGNPSDSRSAVHEAKVWRIRDWQGSAGLRQDGVPCREVILTAGSEITLGGVTLVAESLRSIALRKFCRRLIGWEDARLSDVDRALRAIRAAGARRAPLFLRGEGDMILIAQALHRRTLGDRARFIVADPRRGEQPATLRNPASRADGIAAMRVAAGGSLCIREERPPVDFDAVLRTFREPDSSAQLFVCMRAGTRARDAWLCGAELIELPSLDSRKPELPRIIAEYASDATTLLNASGACFLEVDREWISRLSARSLPDIEKATLRAVAVRTSRSLSEAARMLGMAPVSLSRWLARRETDPRTGKQVRFLELRKADRMPVGAGTPSASDRGARRGPADR